MATPKKILIAEDVTALRDFYASILASAGYTVTAATDGEDAYHQLPGGPYDLFLLDILMPKLNGIDLLERLKQEDKHASVPRIVMLTNLSDDMKIAQALQYGIRGYMIKSSYTPDKFLEEVEKYVNSEA